MGILKPELKGRGGAGGLGFEIPIRSSFEEKKIKTVKAISDNHDSIC